MELAKRIERERERERCKLSFLGTSLVAIVLLIAPQATQAALYLPGATLDPACAPTDPNCGISTIVASSTANSIPYYAADGSILSATSTFQILSNGTASTTNLIVVNSLTLGSLSGFLKATAGAIATSLINLASDVTGILPVANGGTGVSAIASGYIPFGNGTGAVATSSALYFDSSNGRLGIGTSTPWAQLSVNPDGITGPSFAIGSSTATSFIVTNGGYVGVGTTSPFTNLSVVGNGYFSGSLNVGDAATTRSNLGLSYTTTADINTLSKSIATWGDSLTNPSPSAGLIPYPTQLATLSSYTVYGGGVPSEKSTQIANRMLAATDKYSWPTVIWAGRNDYQNAATVEANIASMVSALTSVGNNNYLVLGVINASTTSETIGQSSYNQIIALNSYLSTTYGAHYFDIRSYLISNGLSDAGITPTAADTWDIAQDVPPDSLRNNDTLHLNSAGYGVVAARVYAQRSVLGVNTAHSSSVVPTLADLQHSLSDFSAGYSMNGVRVFYATSTNYLTAAGVGAGNSLPSTALYNTAIGYQALYTATSSVVSSDTAVGYTALASNTTGSFNSAMGKSALYYNTTGSYNSAFGSSALYYNTSSDNSAFGYYALAYNTTGSYNSAFGKSALSTNSTGASNSAFGWSALNNSTGSYNSAFGTSALYYNTTGTSNTAMGRYALTANTTGGSNSAFGTSALTSNVYGSNNSAFGTSALYYASSTNNTAIGFGSAYGGGGNYTNQGGVYLGFQSGYSAATSSDYNTFLGYKAGYDNTTGYDNIIIGPEVNVGGNHVTTGGNNIFIGYNAVGTSTNSTNYLNIGNSIFGTLVATSTSTSLPTNFSAVRFGIGTTSPATTLEVGGDITTDNVLNCATLITDVNGKIKCTSSDERLKQDITPLDAADSLAAIEQLKPVSFHWRNNSDGAAEQLGFIAQDVQQIFPELVSKAAPTPLTPDGTLTFNYLGLISPMVKAIQELAGQISSLAATVAGFAQDFTSANGHFTNTLCVGSTCVTEAQLKTILQNNGQQSNQQQSDSNGSPQADGGGESPAPAVLTTITVSTPVAMTVGATQMLTATGLDQYGVSTTTTPVWSSNDTAIATVDATTGEVTAVVAGTAIITATDGTVHGDSETLTVTSVPADPPADPAEAPAE